MSIEYADIVFGLAWGDEGKGKVISRLSNNYDIVARWAGGANAGHTIYLNGKRYKSHIIPSGVFTDSLSFIGPGCVVNESSFLEEISYLKENGFDTSLVKISPRAFLVEEEHLKQDIQTNVLGTTNKGIGPTYTDKAARRGKRVTSSTKLLPYIEDLTLHGRVLCEGAQGFWLDLDWGNYPYVTSSTTLPYGACSLGISPKKIRDIIGVAKLYDTRVGNDPDFPETLNDDPELSLIQTLGEEFGTTTGRKRKVNWLNLDKLIQAINISGATTIIINKCDIINEAKLFKFYYYGQLLNYDNLFSMIDAVRDRLLMNCLSLDKNSIHFSFSNSSI
jgi:adenylosuccinate synthase